MRDEQIVILVHRIKEKEGETSLDHYLSWIPPRDRKILLIITLLGFLLRIWNLGSPSFWYDEVLTLNRSETLFEESESLLLRPPSYYFLAWLFIQLFGASETSIRLPSVLFGTLTIPLVYMLTARIKRTDAVRSQPVLAALFLTVFPLHIAASREAKEYAFLAFLVLLTMLLVIEAIHRESLSLVFSGAVVQTIGLLTNFLAWTIIFPIFLYFWLKFRREEGTCSLRGGNIRATSIFVIVPAFVYGSWLLLPREGFHEPTKGMGWSDWFDFGEPYWYILLLLLYAGVGLVFVLVVMIEWRNKGNEQVFVLSCYILMILVLSIYHLKAQRYFVIAVPITMIFIAEGTQWLCSYILACRQQCRLVSVRSLGAWALIGLTISMPVFFLLGFFAGDGHAGYHPDWQGACAFVRKNSNSEIDSYWSTHGTIRIARYYLGEEYQVGDITELETHLSSSQNESSSRIWIILTKNRFDRKIAHNLQEQIITEGSLVWDKRAEDLTTHVLADFASQILDSLGFESMNWWYLDRMWIYRIVGRMPPIAIGG